MKSPIGLAMERMILVLEKLKNDTIIQNALNPQIQGSVVHTILNNFFKWFGMQEESNVIQALLLSIIRNFAAVKIQPKCEKKKNYDVLLCVKTDATYFFGKRINLSGK